MKEQRYTTQLQAGLGLIQETKVLLELWQPGMSTTALYQAALHSGLFPNVTARRLRNIVAECFAPRFLIPPDHPAEVLKTISSRIPQAQLIQLLFLFTARANQILADFVKEVFWIQYSSGQSQLGLEEARLFVTQANQKGKTAHPWSESTIQRVSGYLIGCCADFGLLETSRKRSRRILSFRLEPSIAAIVAYDLHFFGLGDNAIIAHPDWQLFGLQREDIREELKRLSLKGYLILQTAGDVNRIGWLFKNWEDLIHVVAES